ncbi:MAG TPA: ornithine cyclodeaminase family protein [Candidatus Binatia bacterium]|nr:ornithine cyclodeaminase family protein [Candidatus Binatia bacterium]
MALIISEAQTRKLIDMPQAIKVLDRIFHDRSAGKMRSLPRRRLKGSDKQLNIMAAWHQDADLLCLRAYAAAANTVTLYNGRTGQIQAIINMGFLSSLRTGAATAVAAKYLAPANAKTLGVIGPGWQATFQVEAVANVFPIQRVVVWGRTPKRRKDFIKEMSKVVKADWREANSSSDTEAEADILVVATDATTPVAHGTHLKEEVLVASIGANSSVKHEITNDLIRHMNYIVTDDLPTARIDSGDLIAACEFGILRWDGIVPLDSVVGHGAPTPRPKRVLFQSNGIADEDLAVGKYVLDQAKRKKLKLREVTEI